MNNSTDGQQQLVHANEEIAHTLIPAMVYLAVLMLLGIVGNLLVCFVFFFRLRMTTQNFLIIALAVFDLLSCFIAMPTEIVDMRYFLMFDNEFACRLLRFVIHFCAFASILTLIVIAVDRYLKVCRPLQRQMSLKHGKVTLLAVLLVALVFATPALLLYGIRTTEVDHVVLPGKDCSSNDRVKDTAFPLVYNSVLFLAFFVILITLTVIYIRIWREMKRHRLYMARNSLPGGSRFYLPTVSEACSASEFSHRSEERRPPSSRGDHGNDDVFVESEQRAAQAEEDREAGTGGLGESGWAGGGGHRTVCTHPPLQSDTTCCDTHLVVQELTPDEQVVDETSATADSEVRSHHSAKERFLGEPAGANGDARHLPATDSGRAAGSMPPALSAERAMCGLNSMEEDLPRTASSSSPSGDSTSSVRVKDVMKDDKGMCDVMKDDKGVCDVMKDDKGVCDVMKDDKGVCDVMKDDKGVCDVLKDDKGMCDVMKDDKGMCDVVKDDKGMCDVMKDEKSMCDVMKDDKGMCDPGLSGMLWQAANKHNCFDDSGVGDDSDLTFSSAKFDSDLILASARFDSDPMLASTQSDSELTSASANEESTRHTHLPIKIRQTEGTHTSSKISQTEGTHTSSKVRQTEGTYTSNRDESGEELVHCNCRNNAGATKDSDTDDTDGQTEAHRRSFPTRCSRCDDRSRVSAMNKLFSGSLPADRTEMSNGHNIPPHHEDCGTTPNTPRAEDGHQSGNASPMPSDSGQDRGGNNMGLTDPDVSVPRLRASKSRSVSAVRGQKATVIAMSITLVFFLSFVPHLSLITTRSIDTDFDRNLQGAGLVLYNIFLRSYFINSVSNPFIYGVLNARFRLECVFVLRHVFSCRKGFT